VSPFELASRVSYFLWSSMPDEELMTLAESGKLGDPRVLEAQVDRMLADPRAAAFADNFAGQWLETRNLDVVKPDPELFKQWNPELREAMKTETSMFFAHVLRENRPLSDFLNADYTFLNERLAATTGIAGSAARVPQVSLTTDRRGGVLSQGGVLTVSSYPTRTSPVIRGKYVLQNLLGIPPAPPPPDVPALEESAGNEPAIDARAAGDPSSQSHLRVLPSQHGPAGLWPGELRRHRPMARPGRGVHGRCERHASRWAALCHGGRDAVAARLAAAAIFTHADPENADLRAAERAQALRSPHGRQHPARGGGRPVPLQDHGARNRQKFAIPSPQGRRCYRRASLMYITGRTLPRRTFLRGVGTAVALPFLDAMTPALAKPQAGKHRFAWRLSTCRMAWTCGTGT
jgi:hypothetical protein